MVSYASHERALLADLLVQVGPNHLTLCEGWQTKELLIHLLLRERHPISSALRMVIGATGHFEQIRARYEALPWEAACGLLRSGPPATNLLAWPPFEAAFQTVEFYVHHEDVRRAEDHWEPRVLEAGFEADLWRRLKVMGRLLLRKVPLGVKAETPDGKASLLRPGTPEVVIRGPASEIVLYVFGRKRQARVSLEGEEWAKAILESTSLGI